MGTTAADTEHEIGQLRGDMTAALDELQRRLRGGLRGVASAEARITSVRAREDVIERARENPPLLGVAGVVAVGAVAYGSYALISKLRDRQKPQNRLRRGVEHVGHELSARVEDSKRQIERARQRGLLLKLEPESGGYVRLSDARLEPLGTNKKRERTRVIKKLVWAGLLSAFMALSSVLARRVADSVWRVTVHEEPPDTKSKTAS